MATPDPFTNPLDALDEGPVLIRADALLDDRRLGGRRPHPGVAEAEPARSLLLELGARAPADALGIGDPRHRAELRVLAAGPEAEARADGLAPARVVDLAGHALMPAMANAHTHLDLTSVGPRPHDPGAGFDRWIGLVMRERPTEPDAVRASVAEGVRLSLRAGVIAVGDIAGAVAGEPGFAAAEALLDAPLAGVALLELLGIGRAEAPRRQRLESADLRALLERGTPGPVRVGLQPHAPYSTGRSIYERARQIADQIADRVADARNMAVPLGTHLAETLDERRFVGSGTGPQRDLLARLGLLVDDDPLPDGIGQGEHPAGHLAGVLHDRAWILAHVNDAPDHAVRTLLACATAPSTRSTVAWCPRAWEYFGHRAVLGPHRWMDLHDAGVPVALATDSIINLPPDRARTHGIGVLDEAREGARIAASGDVARPPTPAELLAMVTTVPAGALGLDPDAFRFIPGRPIAGVVAVRTGSGKPAGARHHDAGTGAGSGGGGGAEIRRVWDGVLGATDHAPELLAFAPACARARGPASPGSRS